MWLNFTTLDSTPKYLSTSKNNKLSRFISQFYTVRPHGKDHSKYLIELIPRHSPMKGKRHDWAKEWSNLEQLDQSCAGLSKAIQSWTQTQLSYRSSQFTVKHNEIKKISDFLLHIFAKFELNPDTKTLKMHFQCQYFYLYIDINILILMLTLTYTSLTTVNIPGILLHIQLLSSPNGQNF